MSRRLMVLGFVAAALLAGPFSSSLAAQAKAPTKAAGKAPTKSGAATTPEARQAAADSAERIVFEREVYRYPREGRRDPFASLIATGDIRPFVADLIVSGIIYDAGGRSVAMLEDVSTGDLYRARVGSVYGRLRVTAITARTVSLAIDEFGFTRQETLTLQTPAARTP
jgi:hypothetical protein